jgi:tRNA pseudouridine38-40 synthase
MRRYVLEVMYDGTCFHGSQIQGLTPTVQLAVNAVLETLLRSPVPTVGASRTDEGVHALSNYYHFDTDKELNPDFLYKCNAILPHGIAVKRVFRAIDPQFNVRFEAVRRSYRYRIYRQKDPFLVNKALFYPYPLNFDLLRELAGVFKEYTGFESFCKRNAQTHTFNCTIHESRWERHGGELHYVVTANRFLRGMVRGMVATQLRIVRENGSAGSLRAIIEANDCTKARFNVAGYGLYLEEINYPPEMLTLVFG